MGKGIRQHHSAGMTKHPLYSTYRGMIQRCEDKNHVRYQYYGGRNIKVCTKWREDFFSFVRDMGEKPSLQHSLDRTNNEGDYTPENCRWANATEQTRNRSLFSNNTQGVTGVSKHGKYFRAYINVNKERVWLGLFKDLGEAVNARLKGEADYWGIT